MPTKAIDPLAPPANLAEDRRDREHLAKLKRRRLEQRLRAKRTARRRARGKKQ